MSSISSLTAATRALPVGQLRQKKLQRMVDMCFARGYPLTELELMNASLGELKPWAPETIKTWMEPRLAGLEDWVAHLGFIVGRILLPSQTEPWVESILVDEIPH
jgi:hypothetical protein